MESGRIALCDSVEMSSETYCAYASVNADFVGVSWKGLDARVR